MPIAACLAAFRAALDDHNAQNPTHTASGIGLCGFDLDRLGFEDGETVAAGITVHRDGGVTGNFRIICDGLHGVEDAAEAQEPVKAVSDPNPQRSEPVYAMAMFGRANKGRMDFHAQQDAAMEAAGFINLGRWTI